MAELIMMYVYFDAVNDIKAISPLLEPQYKALGCTHALFPLAEVEDFLTAKKNPFNFFIESRRRHGQDIYKISPKIVETNYIRSIDNYLTQIVYQNKEVNAIRIENNIPNKKLYFHMSEGLVSKLNDVNLEDEEEYSKLSIFRSMEYVAFYFTTKDDPSFLIRSILIQPDALINSESLEVSYTEDLSNVSVYTKKIFSHYSYRELKGS